MFSYTIVCFFIQMNIHGEYISNILRHARNTDHPVVTRFFCIQSPQGQQISGMFSPISISFHSSRVHSNNFLNLLESLLTETFDFQDNRSYSLLISLNSLLNRYFLDYFINSRQSHILLVFFFFLKIND